MNKPIYYMNPFDFVPLPDSPRPLPDSGTTGKMLEGYIDYSVVTKTPLHITGRTEKDGKHFKKKAFYENYGRHIIPGSSVRGMLLAFVEAVTGSDLTSHTRGDEEGSSGPPYAKRFDARNAQKSRHVGFLMTSPDDPNENKYLTLSYRDNRGNPKTRCKHERHETLPKHFGRHLDLDAARYLFGFVDEEEKADSGPKDQREKPIANAGRLVFEDIAIPKTVRFGLSKAWDLNSDAIMGGPNPRANSGWYFTPGEYRVRKTDKGFRVWEALADKVRGRKFYFHQDPAKCHAEYAKWTWMPLVDYDVETVPTNTEIPGGRIYFAGLNESMLVFLAYALCLEPGMAHKLGALKPFGFGSVALSVNGLFYRDMARPLDPLESQGLKGSVPPDLLDPVAYSYLRKIMRFPEPSEAGQYLFLYPPFNPRAKSPEEKGFAMVENAEDRAIAPGNMDKRDCTMTLNPSLPPGHPTPGKSKKTTLFFDHYQMNAVNFPHVMGGPDYSHL